MHGCKQDCHLAPKAPIKGEGTTVDGEIELEWAVEAVIKRRDLVTKYVCIGSKSDHPIKRG